MRRLVLAGALALSFVAAACGQKPGVGGAIVAGGTGEGGALTAAGTTETAGAAAGAAAVATGTGGPTATGGPSTGATKTGAATGTGAAAGGQVAAAASGPEDRTGITKDEIRIGIHAPETGAAAVSTFAQAVGVYSQWAGKIPGLGNRKIVVYSADDKFDPSEARRVCKQLVEVDKVFLLIGGAGVDAIKSCSDYAASKGVPYLSPGVTEAPFRNDPGYFALSETYDQQSVQLAQLIAHQIKKTKVGVILTDSPLLDETAASFKTQASTNGLSVVYTGKLAKDAGKTQTDTEVSNLKKAGAEVVYALISPTVFGFLVSSAKQQQYTPTFTGPGLSNGVNLIAAAVCQPPFPDIRFLSPMIEMDQINSRDPNYVPAYKKKNGQSSQPDDIGILLWGIEKMIRQLMESAGPNLSRQSLLKVLSQGRTYATNVFSPVKYGPTPHFGASTITLLTLNCQKLQYTTTTAFASHF
jgi:ABC-type branched-subunit amino acid transport system substrate-binding protein